MTGVGAGVADLGLPGGRPRVRRPAARVAALAPGPPAAPSPALASAGRVAAHVGGPALAVTYLSLLVLLPLAALVTNAFSDGWAAFWARRHPARGASPRSS